MSSQFVLLTLLLNLSLAITVRGAAEDGERLLTPNQQRRIVQINRDLPQDIVNQAGDSRKVAELRDRLRQACANYKQAVKQFGSPTQESRQAGHLVVEAQEALHKQFIQEEAIPAISQLPQ